MTTAYRHVPSVVTNTESDEPMEEATATATIGDLKNQLEHLRVSEALEAVSHTFHEQANFCGTPLSTKYWFGSISNDDNDQKKDAVNDLQG
jgi:hypothetical protein